MDENVGRKFLPLNVYDCYSTTKAAIDKWIAHVESVHQRGLEFIFQEVLILVGGGGGGWYKNARNLRKSAPTFIVVQQPEELWTNGDDSAIQRIKLVWNSSFKKF